VIKVLVYSRTGCHLCDVAMETLTELQKELEFSLELRLIDDDPELEVKYGEQIPVTLINGQPHDFWRVSPERFRAAIAQL
jgi:glutaredoxin